MITVRFPERSEELISFELSPLLETVHSWHVLMAPGHHALHIPWVRACRDLPAPVRRELRALGWVVADYVPAFFEVGAEHPHATFDDQLELLAAIDEGDIAGELARTLIDTSRWSGPDVVRDQAARAAALEELRQRSEDDAALLERALADPGGVVARVIAVLRDYWSGGFEREWARLEPMLHDRIARTGRRIAAEGILPILRTLLPEIRVNSRARTMKLDRRHEHALDVADAGGIRFTPSHYAWPHVRVTCDAPWPLRVTYPVAPLGVYPAGESEQDLLASLRALGADVRLSIVRLLQEEPRSTQELAGLLGLSNAAVSRHLRQLLDARLVATRREGYYVVYELRAHALEQVASALRELASYDGLRAQASTSTLNPSRPAATVVRAGKGGENQRS